MAISLQDNNTNNDIKLTPKDQRFVNFVMNKITVNGMIPYRIPQQTIVDVILSSAKYFYLYYGPALVSTFYRINNKEIIQYAGTDKFQHLSIEIDPRIRIVKEIFETNTNFTRTQSAVIDDFANYGVMSGTDRFGGELYGINNNLYLLEAAVKMVEQKAFDNMFKAKLPFSFSQATSTLLLKKQPDFRAGSIVLKVEKDCDIERLYNNTYFERHVIAKTKEALKKVIGGHITPLPGEVTLNVEDLTAGIEDAEKVEELIKASSGIGDIIFKR